MVSTLPIVLAAMGVFAGASFFFALAESSLFAMGRLRARQLARRSPLAGGRVLRLLDRPQELLATIVLGNTLANAALVAVGIWAALKGVWSWQTAWLTLLGLVLLVCEVIPKTLGIRTPEFWAVRVARSMGVARAVLRPIQMVAQSIDAALLRLVIPKSVPAQPAWSDEDCRELLDLGVQQGFLSVTEKETIWGVILLDRRTVHETMIPRAQMAVVDDEMTLDEMTAAARRFKHHRLPVFDESTDTVIGILNSRKLLLVPQTDLSEAIESPSFVPETMNLLRLLKSLQRQRRGLAMVMDEFGGVAGLVTMVDLLGEMIGEIRGESGPEGFVMERLKPGRWRVNGTMRIEDFSREYPALGEVPGIDTIGGLLLAHLGVVPQPGDAISFRGLKLTAQVADERRVREVLVEIVDRKGGR